MLIVRNVLFLNIKKNYHETVHDGAIAIKSWIAGHRFFLRKWLISSTQCHRVLISSPLWPSKKECQTNMRREQKNAAVFANRISWKKITQSLHSKSHCNEQNKCTSRKKKNPYFECYKKACVCRPEIGPKHSDKLKPEPGPTYKSVPVTNTFSLWSTSISYFPLLSLILIWPRKLWLSVWCNCFRFLECARTFILTDGHLFNPTSWNLVYTHTALPRVKRQVSITGETASARNTTVLQFMESYTKRAEVPAAPADSLGGYPVRYTSLYSFLIVHINKLHFPWKNISSCSTLCYCTFHSVVAEIRLNLCEQQRSEWGRALSWRSRTIGNQPQLCPRSFEGRKRNNCPDPWPLTS